MEILKRLMCRFPIFILFLFFFSSAFSQNLEEKIYVAIDQFQRNQNDKSLQILNEKQQVFENLAKKEEELLAITILQCVKAYYLKQNNKLNAAIISYEKAWDVYSKNNLKGYDIIEYCLKPLGNLYTILKNYTSAENIINQYIYLAQKNKNETQIIAGIINLSVVYHNIGNYDKAIFILKKALSFPKINKTQREIIQNNLTANYIALKRYEEIRPIIKEDVISDHSKINFYKNKALIQLEEGNIQKAVFYFNKAKKLFLNDESVSARDLAKFYLEEAQLLRQINRKDKALLKLKEAIKTLLPMHSEAGLPSKDLLYAENTFVDIFDLYGDMINNYDEALKSYDLAFHVSSLLLKNLTSQESKILNAAADKIRSEKCIEILYTKYVQRPTKTDVVQAFQFSERSKSIVLKELERKRTLFKLNRNDSLLVAEQDLISLQEILTDSLVKVQLSKTDIKKTNKISRRLNEISSRLNNLTRKIEKKYGLNTTLLDIPFNKLQNKLEADNAVLVEYFFGKKSIYQFLVSKDSIIIEKIKLNSELLKRIRTFIHFFDNASDINNDINNYTSLAFKIYNDLLLSKTANFKNVVIIPDGILNFVPFEAILYEETSLIDYSKMPFLIKRQNFAYNSNALFYLKENNQKNKSKRLLGCFPVFKGTDRALYYTLEEAAAIKKVLPSKMLMNNEATKHEFKENAPKFDILHLATHARGGSSVIPASIEFYDGTMFLHELYSLNLSPELVVLSACETGVGKLYKTEGAMSIARGFQFAGANNLLFSLWSINDRSTAKIIDLFYRSFEDNGSAFIANNKSKRLYLEKKEINNSLKSPFYWAAFVYYGELDKAANNNLMFYSIGLMFALILILLLIKYFSFRRNKQNNLNGKNNTPNKTLF